MAKQKPVDALRESIRLLEIRQEKEGSELKEHLKITFEGLKPANIIRHSLKELTSQSELKGNLLDTITTLLTGYVTHKILSGKNKNIFRRLLAVVLEFGVSSLVARNAEMIREFSVTMVEKLFKPSREKVSTPEA
jgi:hypothetical protein